MGLLDSWNWLLTAEITNVNHLGIQVTFFSFSAKEKTIQTTINMQWQKGHCVRSQRHVAHVHLV
jgi:hypothetical protein